MFEAIQKNDLRTVSDLLSEGKSVDIEDKEHNTPVHLCLKHNCSLEMLDLLLSYKPISSLINNKGDCFIHTAIKNKETTVDHVARLFKYQSELIHQINFEGHTPLSLACTIKTINPKIISFLLQNSDYIKSRSNKQQEEQEQEEQEEQQESENKKQKEKKKKEETYKEKIKRIQKRQTIKQTNLSKSERDSSSGNLKMKKILKQILNLMKENFNFLSLYQQLFITPNTFKNDHGHLFNTYVRSETIHDPFRTAIKNKLPLEIISLFLESGYDPNFSDYSTKFQSSLHYACKYCPENLLLIDLLLKYGADLELDDSSLRTPLFYSVFCKKKQIPQKEKDREREKKKRKGKRKRKNRKRKKSSIQIV
ncbi:ankyrin repeat-containing protein [Anaeramoeba flamelloides]|uniref:Ankyrin repeat-containing protein n=1 Tax=Anaeramoeba flamelloides TaxID=1746091 RepID=A0AAV8A3X9_9EUKA|nr:ankyrin repeat-containing protein [Anaeramoeba flamelloides]